MRKTHRHSAATVRLLFLFLLVWTLVAACAKAPYTGRSQLILVPVSQELQLGEQAAEDILKEEKLSKDPEKTAMVERVGKRIAAVAARPDFEWEFHTIDNDKTANAFCLPGGKVFVYTGLFKYIEGDAELAAVVGHEIGHALARHGVERMSIALAAQVGGEAASLALQGSGVSGAAMDVFQQAYGLGANVGVILPFSREQEYESDHLGLLLMAQAGYDPGAALSFWEKFAKEGADKKPPEFLSTHPAGDHRIAEIKALLPKARYYYQQSRHAE